MKSGDLKDNDIFVLSMNYNAVLVAGIWLANWQQVAIKKVQMMRSCNQLSGQFLFQKLSGKFD